MKNKKINKIILTMGVLTTISIGLFVYQNFYLSKDFENEIIYVAKEDIPAMSTMTSDMFKAISVPKNGVLPGYVTNINEIVGKELRGGLLANEPLSKSRLIVNTENKFDLEMKLESDIAIPVKSNEYVNVYVVLKDSQGKVEIRNIFDTKQVQVTGSTTENSEVLLTIKVTEEELINYYDAKERGKIIIAKNNSLDAKIDITDKKYDPKSQEAQTAVKPTGNDSETEGTIAVSVIEKKIEEGETLDSLAIKYKTTVENIKNLNNGKEDFKVGDNIVLPAN